MEEYVHSLLNRTVKASMFFPLAPHPLPPLPQLILSYDRVGGHLLQDSQRNWPVFCDCLPNKPFGMDIITGATIWICLQMKTGVPRLFRTYWARTSRWKHEDVNFLLDLGWCCLIVQLSRILMKTVKAALSSLPSSQIAGGQGRTHAWGWSPQLSSNGHWSLKISLQAMQQ